MAQQQRAGQGQRRDIVQCFPIQNAAAQSHLFRRAQTGRRSDASLSGQAGHKRTGGDTASLETQQRGQTAQEGRHEVHIGRGKRDGGTFRPAPRSRSCPRPCAVRVISDSVRDLCHDPPPESSDCACASFRSGAVAPCPVCGRPGGGPARTNPIPECARRAAGGP